MKNTFYSTYILLLILIFTACENMIEIELPNDQMSTENVFKDKQTAYSALANLYSTLRESSVFTGKAQGIGTYLSLYTDELQSTSSSPTADSFVLYNNIVQPTSNFISTIWNNSYSHIYNINSFLINIKNSQDIPNEEKNILTAEALILRAMYYQVLTQVFGNIPYTTSINYKENTFIKKTDTSTILISIENDLMHSYNMLTYDNRSPHKYYPNKAVAEIILAKNFLLRKQYDQAEHYAKNILKNPSYELENNLGNVFKRNAKSTIWQMSNSSPIAATYEARNYVVLTNNPTYKLRQDFIDSYEPNDLRKKNWIKEHTLNNFYAYKYKNSPTNNTDECSILFRIEEAYFILTEALIYQDKLEEAIVNLNTLRQRSGLSLLPTTLTKEELILAMLEESKKEYFLEHGRRFFDLKRNNTLSILSNSKPNWSTNFHLFPYPEKELLINPNLNPQNDY